MKITLQVELPKAKGIIAQVWEFNPPLDGPDLQLYDLIMEKVRRYAVRDTEEE